MENKWTAQELLDSLNRECSMGDINELWKALIAFESGATEIDNQALEKTLDWFYNNDTITSVINEEILQNFQKNVDID